MHWIIRSTEGVIVLTVVKERYKIVVLLPNSVKKMLKIQKVNTCSGCDVTGKTVNNVFPGNSSLKSDDTGTNRNAC